MARLEETPVVSCLLRNRSEVLLLRRSAAVGSYQGRWGVVAGHAEGDPDRAAWREIEEETGFHDAVTLVRRGEPFAMEDAALGKRWIIHPYLFDCDHREVRLDWESTEADWASPTELLRRDTVPDLWTSYARVAPSVETIRADREHGAAYLSYRALEVLRDRAGLLAARQQDASTAWPALRKLARALLEARPSMAALANRIHRVMHACRAEATAAEQRASEGIAQALAAEEAAAKRAARLVAGRTVLTLSRSGTVTEALLRARPRPAVVVAESRPGGEGAGVARRLAEAGLDVTLIADAAVAAIMADGRAALVLVGADTVLPSGAVVNKTGTRAAALAARFEALPFYAVAARDKVSTQDAATLEEGEARALYEGEAPVSVLNPTFDVTPPALITGLVMEDAVHTPGDIPAMADELRRLTHW